ncbi:hypothetical protein BJ508DRAFT_413006 [Ascobolus immersus RN42]|uniref:DUF924-domain-containing protein n=1 Tax=Ascobolus immersus RN42 TaxID=1160509 RepID=A0A3N4IIJ3_ASCIM|nr:hypothetical protein BJ508DRAFT_413006 [Ascobolus immersus RN42]
MTFTLDKAIFNPTLYKRLQHFWFADLTPSSKLGSEALQKKWFGQGTPDEKLAFDTACAKEFLPALDSIGPKAYKLPPFPSSYSVEVEQAEEIAAPFLEDVVGRTDGEGPRNALSLMLLLDQMPRNIFRDSKAAPVYTHYDRLSRALLTSVFKRERPDLDPRLRYTPVFRMWFYMPLMHSEWMEHHKKCTELLCDMKKDIDEDSAKILLRNDASEEEKKDAEGGAAFSERMLHYEKLHSDMIAKWGRYPYRNEAIGRETTQEEKEWLESGAETFGTKHSAQKK